VSSLRLPDDGSLARVNLGPAGFFLCLFLLLGSVLILMNLERTFRASVGTMRWRFKFMVLGVGILLAVRAYSRSQALLLRSISLYAETLDSLALLVAAILVIRSLYRAGNFDLNVYPSHSVLQQSF